MPLFSVKCTSTARLDGKTAVVTGSNTGIGRETVKDLYKRGCRVFMACRDLTKAEEAANAIRSELKDVQTVGSILVASLDLSSFKSVRSFADLMLAEPSVNLLINNAGVASCPHALTEDGFETQFAVNHLGHFLLTLLLLPRLLQTGDARVVNVSSMAHIVGKINFDDINSVKKYGPTDAYAQSKLANVLFAAELARRLEAKGLSGVTTYSLHPGVVNTDAMRHWSSGSQWLVKNVLSGAMKSPEQGAQTTIYCAVDEKAGKQTGLYYSDCKKKKASSKARDPQLAAKLWDESVKMVGLESYDPFVVGTSFKHQEGAHKSDGATSSSNKEDSTNNQNACSNNDTQNKQEVSASTPTKQVETIVSAKEISTAVVSASATTKTEEGIVSAKEISTTVVSASTTVKQEEIMRSIADEGTAKESTTTVKQESIVSAKEDGARGVSASTTTKLEEGTVSAKEISTKVASVAESIVSTKEEGTTKESATRVNQDSIVSANEGAKTVSATTTVKQESIVSANDEGITKESATTVKQESIVSTKEDSTTAASASTTVKQADSIVSSKEGAKTASAATTVKQESIVSANNEIITKESATTVSTSSHHHSTTHYNGGTPITDL